MNRTIKFRGKRSDNGEFVFGSYCYEDYGKRDARLGILHAIIDEGGEEFIVDADSIAQLVGVDKNGREVYEGDKILIDDAGEDEFFATCLPVGVNHWGGCFLHGGNFIFTKEFSLKEACQNPWNALQEIDNLIERHCEEASRR